MLHVITHLWGDKYGEHYVRRLNGALKRNIKQPFRFLCLTDRKRTLPAIEQAEIADRILLAIPGCFARLRVFDARWQQSHGIRPGERIVSIDLDAVVTACLDPLFDKADGFAILQDINTTNPCPYNGSLWTFKAGTHGDVWSDFSVTAANEKTRIHAFADDQGWFEYKIPGAIAFTPTDGVYGFKKRGWPAGDDLPQGARLVAFPGWRDPSKVEHLGWVKGHWRLD